jgi:hypothetical protein
MRNLKARHLKMIAWTVAAVALILASARPALAFVSHGGGVHHRAVVVHGRVFVGHRFGPPFFGPRFFGPRVFVGPVFLGPAFGPAYYPSPVIYPAPVVVQQPAPAYAQAAPSSEYWYYCPDNRAYFPYAQQCPSSWLQVVPSPGPIAPGPR